MVRTGRERPDVEAITRLATSISTRIGEFTIFDESQVRDFLLKIVLHVGDGPGLSDTARFVLALHCIGSMVGTTEPGATFDRLRPYLSRKIARLVAYDPDRFGFFADENPVAPDWMR